VDYMVDAFVTLTNTVYPPSRDASRVQLIQTWRIYLVGLKRRPEGGQCVVKGVCKLYARVHTQIMTAEWAHVLICTFDFATNPQAGGCPIRARVTQRQLSMRRTISSLIAGVRRYGHRGVF
jgi:hypothetical protein